MGTLSHPILTLTAAYSHPFLPSSTQYVVTTAVEVRIKRTLGCASARDDVVAAEALRGELVAEWEAMRQLKEVGLFAKAQEVLKGMEGRLEAWITRGREATEEIMEMKEEVMKCVEQVWSGQGVGVMGITIPERAVRRGDIPRGSPYPTHPKGEKLKQIKSTPASSSSGECEQGCDSRSIKSEVLGTSCIKRKKERNQSHRRESEKLVEDAIIRGQPVTLFHGKRDNSPILLSPVTPSHRSAEHQTLLTIIPSRSHMAHPASPSRASSPFRSREVTPTPADPYGLRQDIRASTPQSASSPRKQAALYTTPRWPRSGRPSPSTPTHSPIAGRKDFGTATDGDSVMSIYDELEDDGQDPAMKIWRGIDEEYVSPEGGRFTRRRKLRRQTSIRYSGHDG
jgi:hypothetical protein